MSWNEFIDNMKREIKTIIAEIGTKNNAFMNNLLGERRNMDTTSKWRAQHYMTKSRQ